jgi:nickel-dependent lactate racemase
LVEVWLPYGKTEICVRIPTKNLLDTIEPNDRVGAENPRAEIENALMNPVGTKRLTETVKPGDKVSVVLKDCGVSTNQIIVLTILKELNSAGIRNVDVRIIFAYDPLRFSSPQGETLLPSEVLSGGITFSRHDCEVSEHVSVGKTSLGTDVYLNRKFADADVKVVAGVVEPHPYAGYSGGQEGILPGISSFKTIQHNLSYCLEKKAERGSIEGNPVHEDMVEATRLAGVDFTLNIIRNKRLEVVKAFAGDSSKAFEKAVELVDEIYKVPVESRADVLFVSPGGYPFDANLFEASKSLDVALKVTGQGKAIVIVAECADGYGNREFYEAMSRFKDSKGLKKSLKRRFSVGGFMAFRLMTSLQSAKIFLVSTMPDYYASEAFRMQTAKTANEAFRYASNVVGKNARVSFASYGNLTIPSMKAAEQDRIGKEINSSE